MSLGEVVKQWRLANDWKQDELARRAGLTQSSVAYVESDKYPNVTRKTRAGLARAFGVGVDELLAAANGSGGPPPHPGPAPLDLPAGLDPKWAADFLNYGSRLSARQRHSLLQLARALAEETAEQRGAVAPEEAGPQEDSL
jgi:transcriptional regulator with XRE-family HTH domain